MRIENFKQSPFVSHDGKNLAYITVGDWDYCNPYEVCVLCFGEEVYKERIFAPQVSVMLPVYDAEAVITVRITPFEDTPVEREYTLTPPKALKVPFLYSSHEDLGYCAYIDKLHRECYEYLIRAMELCCEYPEFKYFIEHIWWLDAFDSYATGEEKERLRALISDGKIEINAIQSGVHTGWQDSEMLVRSLYFGTVEAKKKYGACPSCAIYTDLSGLTRAAISAHTDMGIKYMGVFFNDFRNAPPPEGLSPLFRWKCEKSGRSVLFWWQRGYRPAALREIWCDTKRQYAEGEFYIDETKLYKTEAWLTDELLSHGEFPYDVYPISFYDDREYPTSMLVSACRALNKKWRYPEFSMGIPSEFLAVIDEKYGDIIPTLTGDIPDQWADFAAIAPRLTSKHNEAQRKLYDAQMLTTIYKSCDFRQDFRQAAWDMSCFDEHCWATSSKHPQAMHRYNIDKVKREPIERTHERLSGILRDTAGTPSESGMSVISTYPHERDAWLSVSHDTPIPKGLAHQILPTGECISAPIKFKSAEVQRFDSQMPSSESREYKGTEFSTPYYRVRINGIAKRIDSIIELKSGRELLDRRAEYELGQFIYTYSEGKLIPPCGTELPKKREIRVYEGDVAFVITTLGYEEQSAATVKSRFIFYKHGPRIDMKLSYEGAQGLIGDFNDRYKKNYFYAFPFNVAEPKFYTELAVGELCENEERIMGVSDFTVSAGCVCAEGKDGGIILYSKDMPIFHLGSIKFNRFEREFNEGRAHFYLYASSNRSNNLIYKSIDECHAEFELSVLPYEGSHRKIMSRFSDECKRELITGGDEMPAGEIISIEPCGVRLSALKNSEDGEAIIIRLTEGSGERTSGRIRLPFKPKRAAVTDNCECELYAASVDGDEVLFSIEPSSYCTVKIWR